MTRSLAQLSGRVGGLRYAASPRMPATAANARRGFLARFEAQVDPSITDPAERAKAAERLLSAHMAALSLKRAQKRRKAS